MTTHGRRVFVSFLGTGDYDSVTYFTEDGRLAQSTPYVQAAELELLGPFEQAIVLATPSSWARHGARLLEAARSRGQGHVEHVVLPEALDDAAQWAMFETVLGVIQPGDRVVFDFTHGFRSVPIVLSAAMEFLRRTRSIAIEGVCYGARERSTDLGCPIVQLRDFYAINAWTDAVARLIDDADARGLTALAERDAAGRFQALADPKLRGALDALTEAIRNVDAPKVEGHAREALAAVARAAEGADLPSSVLLGLVGEKFGTLAASPPLDGSFSADFFRCQIALARLLAEHRLYMQTFTILREHIASLGMRAVPKASLGKGLDRRARYGEVFWNMVLRENFRTQPSTEKMAAKLAPWRDALAAAGLLDGLRAVAKGLEPVRNSLDHAWMNRKRPSVDLEASAEAWITELEGLTERAFAIPFEPIPDGSGGWPRGLVNISNHPVDTWPEDQRRAALERFGEVIEIDGGFPAVSPSADPRAILDLAEEVRARVKALAPDAAVFVAGEMRLTVALVAAFQKEGRPCFATGQARDSVERELPDGRRERTSHFRFEGWVEYPRVVG